MKFVYFFRTIFGSGLFDNFFFLRSLCRPLTLKIAVLGCLFFSACSKDDDGAMEMEAALQPSFELIGVDTEAAYQYNYNGASDTGTELNLTNEIGVPAEFLTIRQVGNTVSFYSFQSGDFSLFQKNILTGAFQSYPGFYTNTTERSIVWGTNSEEAVFFGSFNPQGTTNLAVRKLSLDNLEGADLSLEFNIDRLYQPLYENGKLFITYRTSTLRYKIAVYDTDSGLLLQTLEYGTASPSILIDNDGNLVIFRFSEENRIILEKRDFSTLVMFEESPLAFNQRFPPGPIDGVLVDGKLYYEFQYQQPFALISGPAVFDIASGENNIVDLASIVNRLETNEEISTYQIASEYDESEGVFLVSYGKFNTTQKLEGGVMVITEKGELITNVEVPFIPAYFVK